MNKRADYISRAQKPLRRLAFKLIRTQLDISGYIWKKLNVDIKIDRLAVKSCLFIVYSDIEKED